MSGAAVLLWGMAGFVTGGICVWWMLRGQDARAGGRDAHPPREAAEGAPAAREPMYYVRGWRPLTAEQIAVAMRGWPESDERWRAVWDLHAHHLEAELSSTPAAGTDAFSAGRWCGRIEAMLFLRAQLLHLRREKE